MGTFSPLGDLGLLHGVGIFHATGTGTPTMPFFVCGPCREWVPVGSIAVAKSLVAGLHVCLQINYPLLNLRQSSTVDQAV